MTAEKYRPQRLDGVVGQREITAKLKRYVNSDDLPNLLFSGPSGVGKTTTVLALAREIYGEEWRENVLRIDGSECDDVDEAADRIGEFASTPSGEHDYQLVFLDEASSLRPDAQAVIWEAVQAADATRFVLSCTHEPRIHQTIQRGCETLRFLPIAPDVIDARIQEIADCEGIEITDTEKGEIVDGARGNLRWAITSIREKGG